MVYLDGVCGFLLLHFRIPQCRFAQYDGFQAECPKKEIAPIV
jgi:hypothetical protein